MDSSEQESDTIDLTNNINYQVLSAFFENDNGNNITDILSSICNAINANTDAVLALRNKIDEFQVDDDDDDDEEEKDDDEYEE